MNQLRRRFDRLREVIDEAMFDPMDYDEMGIDQALCDIGMGKIGKLGADKFVSSFFSEFDKLLKAALADKSAVDGSMVYESRGGDSFNGANAIAEEIVENERRLSRSDEYPLGSSGQGLDVVVDRLVGMLVDGAIYFACSKAGRVNKSGQVRRAFIRAMSFAGKALANTLFAGIERAARRLDRDVSHVAKSVLGLYVFPEGKIKGDLKRTVEGELKHAVPCIAVPEAWQKIYGDDLDLLHSFLVADHGEKVAGDVFAKARISEVR